MELTKHNKMKTLTILHNLKNQTHSFEHYSLVENDAKNFRNRISTTKRFGDKGAFIRVNLTNEVTARTSDDYLTSQTNVYGQDPNDINNPDFVLIDQIIRDQFTDGEGKVNNFDSEIRYRLPIVKDAFFINFDYDYNRDKSTNRRSTFDKDADGVYSNFNTDLSTDFEYLNESMAPGISLSYRKEKWSARAGFDYIFRTLENVDLLRPQLSIKRRFEATEIWSSFNYRFSPKVSLWTGYRLNNNPPQLEQLQPFANVTDPLNTIVGNPNLEPSNNHRINMGFNAFDWQKRTGFYSYLSATFIENQVVSKTTIDENFVRETTYANVDGNYRLNGNIDYSKDVKVDSLRTLKFGVGAFGDLSKSINFNNDVQYASRVRSISPSASLTFTWKDVLEIRPRYRITFTKNQFDIDDFEDRAFSYHDLNIRTALFLPKNFEWRNDIQYNYNPNIGEGFQKSAWFWNATLAYSVLQDSGTITLKVYDLLNQNTNARRTATENYIQDSQSTVLEQYFMLSFSWKFNSLGKKGETEGNDVFFFD